MKRLALAIAIGAALGGAAPAQANWDFSAGPHIDTNPLPHRRHRLACPVKTEHFRWCRDSSQRSTPSAPSSTPDRDPCLDLRIQYMARHGARKPRGLRWAHGCELYRLDHAYHSRVDTNPSFSVIGLLLDL